MKSKILSYKANVVISEKYCPYILVPICIKNKQKIEASNQHMNIKHNEKYKGTEARNKTSTK